MSKVEKELSQLRQALCSLKDFKTGLDRDKGYVGDKISRPLSAVISKTESILENLQAVVEHETAIRDAVLEPAKNDMIATFDEFSRKLRKSFSTSSRLGIIGILVSIISLGVTTVADLPSLLAKPRKVSQQQIVHSTAPCARPSVDKVVIGRGAAHPEGESVFFIGDCLDNVQINLGSINLGVFKSGNHKWVEVTDLPPVVLEDGKSRGSVDSLSFFVSHYLDSRPEGDENRFVQVPVDTEGPTNVDPSGGATTPQPPTEVEVPADGIRLPTAFELGEMSGVLVLGHANYLGPEHPTQGSDKTVSLTVRLPDGVIPGPPYFLMVETIGLGPLRGREVVKPPLLRVLDGEEHDLSHHAPYWSLSTGEGLRSRFLIPVGEIPKLRAPGENEVWVQTAHLRNPQGAIVWDPLVITQLKLLVGQRAR